MKWLTVFLCYAADAILVKPKGRLDINRRQDHRQDRHRGLDALRLALGGAGI